MAARCAPRQRPVGCWLRGMTALLLGRFALAGTFILRWRCYFNLMPCGGAHHNHMNCLLEAVASMWMSARRQVVTEPTEEDVMTAQEGLEQCRRNMEGRERELDRPPVVGSSSSGNEGVGMEGTRQPPWCMRSYR